MITIGINFAKAKLIINGRSMQALVESGALHNFLSKELACEAGLRAYPYSSSVKDVNSSTKEVARTASKVHIQMTKWKSHSNFIMVQLDYFDVILG